MADIYELSEDFKKAMEAKELKTLLVLSQAYIAALENLLPLVMDFIEEASELPKPLQEKDAIKLARYKTLVDQLTAELTTLEAEVKKQGGSLQASAVQQGAKDATALITNQFPPGDPQLDAFNQLPRDAIRELLSFAQPGGPLAAILEANGEGTLAKATQVLLDGLVQGKSPNEIVKAFQREWGGSLDRALRIVRTETLRSYREASRNLYKANSGVVTGYVRSAAKNPRTCIACLAADGRFYDLETPLDEHPNGRCALIPVTQYYQPPGETGQQWFDSQPEAVQAQMLGPKKYAEYKSGKDLWDFVKVHESALWGDSLVT